MCRCRSGRPDYAARRSCLPRWHFRWTACCQGNYPRRRRFSESRWKCSRPRRSYATTRQCGCYHASGQYFHHTTTYILTVTTPPQVPRDFGFHRSPSPPQVVPCTGALPRKHERPRRPVMWSPRASSDSSGVRPLLCCLPWSWYSLRVHRTCLTIQRYVTRSVGFEKHE